MNKLKVNLCTNCGGSRFEHYAKLGFDQKIVVERISPLTERDLETANPLVCMRCFYSMEIKETKA